MCRCRYFKRLLLSSLKWRDWRYKPGISFFYRTVQMRLNFNFIRSFLLPSGVVISDPQQMSLHAVFHFQKILGPMPVPEVRIVSTTLWFRSLTDFLCSEGHCLQMTAVPLGFIRVLGVCLGMRSSTLYGNSSSLRSYQPLQMLPSCH